MFLEILMKGFLFLFLFFGQDIVKIVKWNGNCFFFLVGEAKLSVYVCRRNKLEDKPGQDAETVWCCNVRARVWREFRIYKAMDNLETFTVEM